eukprot:gb/GECG01011363.1/.p1 GENE.gb/GECG01011363.1/~~gb/GECG01011363.1/.p1  ORF type:complete len:152 (+),score=15.78 gb/GECG01011363.1/:1-456(+)
MRCRMHETMVFGHGIFILSCVVPMVSATLEAKGSFTWTDVLCNGTRGDSHHVSVDEVLHPLKRDAAAAIHTVQGEGNVRHAQDKWLELEGVVPSGNKCPANFTGVPVNHPFNLVDAQNADDLTGTVHLKEDATLSAKPCDTYEIQWQLMPT